MFLHQIRWHLLQLNKTTSSEDLKRKETIILLLHKVVALGNNLRKIIYKVIYSMILWITYMVRWIP